MKYFGASALAQSISAGEDGIKHPGVKEVKNISNGPFNPEPFLGALRKPP